MHYNTLFQDRNLKNSEEGHLGAPHLALSALGFMRPVFSVSTVGNPNRDYRG